ncbi:hypothetical protein MJG53_017977 [Ovis ammon polii x Ovis aries]|uniref:Uncharacterized protein n=1 Tax=Ovis ammon polii x Ovis aries TaxID=2918886 RepID=A0ACB9U5M3_9CETA|nr:hypothetical protein MJG53_017977 [Ovis ammon polii x Ovis aries]
MSICVFHRHSLTLGFGGLAQSCTDSHTCLRYRKCGSSIYDAAALVVDPEDSCLETKNPQGYHIRRLGGDLQAYVRCARHKTNAQTALYVSLGRHHDMVGSANSCCMTDMLSIHQVSEYFGLRYALDPPQLALNSLRFLSCFLHCLIHSLDHKLTDIYQIPWLQKEPNYWPDAFQRLQALRGQCCLFTSVPSMFISSLLFPLLQKEPGFLSIVFMSCICFQTVKLWRNNQFHSIRKTHLQCYILASVTEHSESSSSVVWVKVWQPCTKEGIVGLKKI